MMLLADLIVELSNHGNVQLDFALESFRPQRTLGHLSALSLCNFYIFLLLHLVRHFLRLVVSVNLPLFC